VFAFENDRLARALSEDAGVEEAFGLCSEMLARTAVGLHRALACRGIMDLDPADLARVLGAADCRIAWADGSGEHRLNDALDRLLACPLLGDSAGHGVSDVVAQVTGGPEMTLADVQKITKRVRRGFGDDVTVTLGALVDPKMRGQIDVLLCAAELDHPKGETDHPMASQEDSCASQVAAAPARRNGTSRVPHVKAVRQMALPPPPPPPTDSLARAEERADAVRMEEPTSGDDIELDERGLDPREAEAFAELEVGSPGDAPTEEVLTSEEQSPADCGEKALFRIEDGEEGCDGVRFDSSVAKDSGMVQSAFNFESPSRGRFDKTEVTMYKGEDLDIPTFMRRRMRITAVE
jgi:cell division protein FtsZ